MAAAVDQCVHCGFCLATCPTYNLLGEEMDSPRGRIYLMKGVLGGELELDAALEYVDRCLGCLACVTSCPSGVKYGELLGPFREMAGELGISPLELAEGILSVANATMERAIRVISVERGYNPADFTLVSFGGAGGLHAAFLARALNIPRVLVPRDPGTLSALGMLLADIIKDYSITLMLEASRGWLDRVEKALEPLKEQALRDLRGEGLMDEEIHLEPALDMRYKGQSFEITVPFTGENTLPGFHQAHEKLYGYCNREKPVEIVNLRLRGRGVPPKPRLVPIKEGRPSVPSQARVAIAEAVFQGRGMEVDVYQREKLLANNILPGPCLVVEYSATLVIPPFARGRVDHLGNIILEMET